MEKKEIKNSQFKTQNKMIFSQFPKISSTFFKFQSIVEENDESHLFQTSVPIRLIQKTQRDQVKQYSRSFNESVTGLTFSNSNSEIFVPFVNERSKNGKVNKLTSTMTTTWNRGQSHATFFHETNDIYAKPESQAKAEWIEFDEKQGSLSKRKINPVKYQLFDESIPEKSQIQTKSKPRLIIVYRGMDQNITYEEPVFIMKKVRRF